MSWRIISNLGALQINKYKQLSSILILDGGLYIGMAGVAYMLWYVSTKFPEYKLKDKAR